MLVTLASIFRYCISVRTGIRHTAFGIRFTDKPTARGLILPSFWHVLFVYGTLISVYIVVRSTCRVRV